jgi:poly(A) polymerase Pap1
VKDTVGSLTGNNQQQAEGKAQEVRVRDPELIAPKRALAMPCNACAAYPSGCKTHEHSASATVRQAVLCMQRPMTHQLCQCLCRMPVADKCALFCLQAKGDAKKAANS